MVSDPTPALAEPARRHAVFGPEKERMTFARKMILLVASSVSHAAAQGVKSYAPVTAECTDLNHALVAEIDSGQLARAESLLSTAIASGADRGGDQCSGLILNNMALVLLMLGRLDEAERYAERSVRILETKYPPDDPLILHPLSLLASMRLELGKIAGAREAFRRMQAIRTQGPIDRALVHGMGAMLLHREGRLAEAETEYLLTFHAWEEAGKGEAADAGAVFNSLGLLYIQQERFEDSRKALDRALLIFASAKDSAPSDRVKVLHVRGVLLARQNAWLDAEQDLSDALAMADRERWVDPIGLRSLLISYAYVLRRNHHRQEAHAIEARAAKIQEGGRSAIVDVTELLTKRKPARK
jgi:tetratricopeptide (TPR) repeat protein